MTVYFKVFPLLLKKKMQVKRMSLIYTILPKVLGHPLLMNRFDYFNFVSSPKN